MRSFLQLLTQCMVQMGSGSAVAQSAMTATKANKCVYLMIINDFYLRSVLIQMQQIQALRFEVDEVGKHVKGSKKRFTWDVSLKDKHHTIVLDFSFISGKVKITVDRKVLLENELPSNVSFQYPFTLDGFALNIIQQGQTFELRINNKVFSHLYTQQRTKTQFKSYEDDVKDIKVNLNTLNPPNQKISLNIGAFGGMKKKKEKVEESAGWDAFSGGSFPNYFGQQSQPQKLQEKPAQPPAKVSSLLDEDEDKGSITTASKVENSLLQDVAEAPKQPNQSFFDLTPPSIEVTKGSSGIEQFNTMQQMFATMTATNQPASKDLDFFAAEQPSKVSVPQAPSTGSSGFDLNFASPHNFATGVGFEASTISTKSFATSSPGSKPLEVDFFNMPSKQQSNAFSKKQSPSQISAFQGQNSAKETLVQNESKLTDLSVEDFKMEKKSNQFDFQAPESFGMPVGSSIQPQANDFNTMQNLFQTTSGISQGNPYSQIGVVTTQKSEENSFGGFDFAAPQNANENDFNTLQNMFKTTNYSNLNASQQSSQISQPKASTADFFKDNKPSAFATMSGAASGGFDFNMASFGTMQANTGKGGQIDFNFMEKKVSGGASSGEGNLI